MRSWGLSPRQSRSTYYGSRRQNASSPLRQRVAFRSSSVENLSGRQNASATHGILNPKVRSYGVTGLPHHFSSASQFPSSDHAHGGVPLPHEGPNGHAISAQLVSSNNMSSGLVRNQMSVLGRNSSVFGRAAMTAQIHNEAGVGHYYWHHNGGFNYCHYNDAWGHCWYGWYFGQNCFWTCYYGNYWWYYNNEFDNWCYWSGDNWWWQDPYELNTVDLVEGDQYIPDQVDSDTAPGRSYVSSDGSCHVKIQGAGDDAYLVDTRHPQVYAPLLLASGVKGVKFFEPQDASPIEIMLTLADGSVQLFDDQGNPMKFESPSSGEKISG